MTNVLPPIGSPGIVSNQTLLNSAVRAPLPVGPIKKALAQHSRKSLIQEQSTVYHAVVRNMSPHLLQVALPALFAVAVYSIYFFAVRPIVARYRDLPNQELASHSFTDSAISKTVSLGHRISNRLAAIGLPWNRRSDGEVAGEGPHRRGSTASDSFLDEDADNMAGFDIRDVHRRREELHRQVLGMEGATRHAQNRPSNTRGGV